MSNNTTATPEATTPEAAIVEIVAGKFTGMLSPFQVTAFGTMVHFGIKREVAHKVATDFGSDLGNAMRNSPDFAAKVGKAKKSGESAIKFTGKGENLMTNSMATVRVCQTLEGLVKEELLDRASLKTSDFAPGVRDYLTDCEVWAAEQHWK